jgi:radial spoke head protein 4A
MTTEEAVQAAKAYLSKSEDGEPSAYDHMVSLIRNMITQRPPNPYQDMESISRDIKKNSSKPDGDILRDVTDATVSLKNAELQKSLFARPDEDGEEAEADDGECIIPDIRQLANDFEETGICLGRDELFRIYLALKKLTETLPLAKCRFWGKIHGRTQNYIIAETQFREGEDEEEKEEEEEEENEEENEEDNDEENNEDALPKSAWKPAPPIPSEDRSTGANKFVYFVCNNPGSEWTRLPDVTPAQLAGARQIKKFFTGNLKSEICAYPPFSGNEENYLRAQIARISAGTQVSPLGFYQFDEDEEGEDEEEFKSNYIENPEFDGIPVRDLADPSLANWVHHTSHILPQGRTVWHNTNKKPEDGEDEEEDQEDLMDEIEPEQGPSLLTSISEDAEVDNMPAWTARLSSNLVHADHALAVLKSNLWLGATSFSNGKRFENVYIGFGLKYNADNYSPPIPPPFQNEYQVGPEITEVEDPTVEEEQAFKKAQEEELMNAEDMDEEEFEED